jgi:hypothetical protein
MMEYKIECFICGQPDNLKLKKLVVMGYVITELICKACFDLKDEDRLIDNPDSW